MTLLNTKAAYGWVAIALHWISAVGFIALYFLGEAMEDAGGRAEAAAARDLHVSVGMLLFTFMAARLFWSFSQPHPRSLEPNRWLRMAAMAVHLTFLAAIAVLIVTGPLAIWSAGRPIEVFDLFSLPSPFSGRVEWLHEGAEEVHELAAKLFWPLIVLHVGGALKHLIIDRDRTMQRMLWVRDR